MRLKLLFSTLLFLVLLSNCKGKQPESLTTSHIPKNTSQHVVVDLANLFSDTENDALTEKIIQYEKTSTNQMAVLTIDTLPQQTTIQHFGTDVANSWGVGTREKDNGLLITISKSDRKIVISTGEGTAQTISDSDCKAIIDQLMVPQFKINNYYKGVDKAIDSLIQLWD